MALKIPADFDVNAQHLDCNERFIRDELRLNITNWAKFRHAIHIGNEAANLHSRAGSVAESTKEAYRELAKSHYEAVTSLGSVSLSLHSAVQTKTVLVFRKSSKDFYFHIGCLLDNLARLIYIVNDPQSATEVYPLGCLKGKLKRHWLDWGTLPKYRGYVRLKLLKKLRGIKNIRNVFTHGWYPPFIPMSDVRCMWPHAVRTKRDFYWPYDEAKVLGKKYRSWVLSSTMMQEDFSFIEKFQNQVFGKLTRDVKKFEKNHNLVIR